MTNNAAIGKKRPASVAVARSAIFYHLTLIILPENLSAWYEQAKVRTPHCLPSRTAHVASQRTQDGLGETGRVIHQFLEQPFGELKNAAITERANGGCRRNARHRTDFSDDVIQHQRLRKGQRQLL